jgi:hypothetical protein
MFYVGVRLRECVYIYSDQISWPITVATRSKAWTVLGRLNAGILSSNPTRGMDVCVHFFCV